MHRLLLALLVFGSIACGGVDGSLGSSDATDESFDAAMEEVVVDAGPCDLHEPFGAPVALVGDGLVSGFDYAPTLTADELTLLFSSLRDDASTYAHIYAASRPSVASPFSAPAPITAVNGPTNDSDPALSADGLTLYFQSDRAGGTMGDIYVATRAALVNAFGTPAPVANVNTADDETQPALDADGSLWLSSTRDGGAGGYDLYRAPSSAGGFETPVAVTELNSPGDEWSATLSSDGLTIFFSSNRGGGAGAYDIYVATRASVGASFSAPTNVTELNTPENELPHWLSVDGCRLYLERSQNQGSSYEMYVATRPK